MTTLQGSWATVLLPIEPDESIDFDRLQEQLDYLTSVGVSGIYTNGSAGEFYAQTEAEFERIQKMVAKACQRAGIPFQIGASHMSAQISLERVGRTANLKPLAYQVILPEWFTPTFEEAVAFLRRMAKTAAPAGLVLYNPPHARLRLEPVDFGHLKLAVPQLIGIKVAGGDDEWYAAMRRHGEGLAVFVPGHHLATGIASGAAGAYSNVACLQPVGAQRWYQLIQRDLEAALEVEGRIRDFMATHIGPFITKDSYTNTAADKLLAAIGGWGNAGVRLRWPFRAIPFEEVERLRPVARAMLPELFDTA